jgi:hypothetical protein
LPERLERLERLKRLYAFANSNEISLPFVPPVLRAILLHSKDYYPVRQNDALGSIIAKLHYLRMR